MKEKREPSKSVLVKSPYLTISKNVKENIDAIVEEQGLIAQEFIEQEIKEWEQVPFILTKVCYKKEYDESLLLFDFHPVGKQGQEHPSVQALLRRQGRNKGDDISGVEEYYVPTIDMYGSIPKIYRRVNGEIDYIYLDEDGASGFDQYHEIMGLIIEVENNT